MDYPSQIGDGKTKTLHVDLPSGSRKEIKRAMAEIDPDMTYEDFLVAAVKACYEEPDLFRDVYHHGVTFGE